jgi:F0F1-type ATP synthase membrane subunit b/b'
MVIVEDAKARATEEGNKIIAAAKVEAEQQVVKAREALRVSKSRSWLSKALSRFSARKSMLAFIQNS